jgi:mannosyl-oligosaccharide alpha-1,2-mannosidase
MVFSKSSSHAIALVACVNALPANVPRQVYDVQGTDARAQAVIGAFRTSWEGYYEYAFPNDELKPVTNGFSNSRYL